MCNSTTFALRHTQISLSGILRHFRPPSCHLLLNTHDANMEFLQLSRHLLLNTHDANMEFLQLSRHLLLNTHDTNMEFLQLSGPCSIFFLFFSKTKIFHSHPWNTLGVSCKYINSCPFMNCETVMFSIWKLWLTVKLMFSIRKLWLTVQNDSKHWAALPIVELNRGGGGGGVVNRINWHIFGWG